MRGDYAGMGTAAITSTSIQITAQIIDSTGTAGTLTATIPMVNHRFAGNGTAMGQSTSISGRMDPADLPGTNGIVLTAPRLVATFSTANGKFGRIVGGPTPSGS